MTTGMQESRYRALRQFGGGPALGFWQMEPATHQDLWDNFLQYRPELALKVQRLMTHGITHDDIKEELATNLAYAAAMCRIHYYRAPSPLPGKNLNEMADYWKTWYNTYLGKGTVEEFKRNGIELWRTEGKYITDDKTWWYRA